MPPSRGFRRKSRKVGRKRERGFIKRLIENLQLSVGDKVCIKIDPSVHKGMPHRRYHGKVGIIVGKRGRALEVKTNKGKKEVILIVRPEHLVKL
ncbi:50S ribosomal protein L21e [Candidatus Geothermarchaeota archaeon]|nr:MAG: 50S ribosomal protein L21e [Candidatus Geothermarchaeota archaeon]